MLYSSYNPDVLTCLANLSSDEVFTPPQIANSILDMLPTTLWRDPNVTFLDPVCKSGVFLREAARRLVTGLEVAIPDKQARINHIFTKQLHGLAITELTALLARRSVYCSKAANSKYSVCDAFNDPQGKIRFNRTEHAWENDHCVFCGAAKENHQRGDDLETHAYPFIHTDSPEEIFNMKFDVIMGNPPYQLNDGGGTGSSASPLYHRFVMQAQKLTPRYLVMIIPSRWFSGGKGLDSFRADMLKDNRIRKIVDYADSRECFPGVDIAGGVCYFLWDREYRGDCEIIYHYHGIEDKSVRALNQFETFVRSSISVSIIEKVRTLHNDRNMVDIVSSRNPFGLGSQVRPMKKGNLTLYWSGGNGPFSQSEVQSGRDLINKWKVLLSKASFDHGGQPDKQGMRRIFSRVEVLGPRDICNESYLIIGSYDTKREAEHLAAFLRTKFCRYLVSTILFTQNIAKDRFQFVPNLPMKKVWTDKDLYSRYGLSAAEISHIETTIRTMEANREQ